MKKQILILLMITSAILANALVYESTDVPVPMPLINHVYESIIDVEDTGTVTDINCTIWVQHSWLEDLNIYLTHNGISVELTTNNGSSGDNYWETTFDDEATIPIQGQMADEAPFTGSYQPEGFLSSFDGSDMSGIWTLELMDDAQGDQGILHAWSIEITNNFEPNLEVSPDYLDFGEIAVDDCSAPNTFLLNNIGTGAFQVQQIMIYGTNYAEFILQNDPSPCTLPPEAEFEVQFCPTSPGYKEVYIQIEDNRDITYVNLSGYGWVMPENENCNLAEPISEVENQYFTTTGTTTSGTVYPHYLFQDIWFVYTAEADGLLEIDLCGSTFDTRLATYESCESTIELAYNDDDDFCGVESLQSHVSLEVEAGEDYYIQVGGAEDESGVGNITITHRGIGTLQGNIVLANGTGSAEDALITAGNLSANPDQSGFYSINLYEGYYSVSAELTDYDSELEPEVLIQSADTTFVDFIMDEFLDVHLPVRDMDVTSGPGPDDAILTWVTPALLDESFEGTFLPEGWLKFNPDGGTGWESLEAETAPLPGWEIGEAEQCPGGENMQVYVSNITGGDTSNEQWMISPQIRVKNECEFKFWMKYYFDEFDDNIEIRISDTVQNDIAAFDIIMADFNLNTYYTTEWTGYSYNLTNYVPGDSEVYIAFREYVADNQNNGSAVSVDRVLADFTDVRYPGELIEYEVYLDGTLHGITEEEDYFITNLIDGITYELGIVAVYNNGESDINTTLYTHSEADDNVVPVISNLGNNFPNPFNPSTTISFSLNPEDAEDAEIIIYNLKGQKVKTFSNFQINQSPNPEVVWDGTDEKGKSVTSGIYLYKLKAGNFEKTKKMLLLK